MSARFEIDKFDGRNDFKLWKRKMKALFIQQKVAKAIEVKAESSKEESTKEESSKEESSSLTDLQKKEMAEIAHSMTILNLGDNVLRRVSEIEDAAELWSKLEEIYVPKTLASKIFLKERYLAFRMDPSKMLEENLDEFTKISNDLVNSGEKIDPDNHAVILLNSLTEKYKEVKSAIKYGRDNNTVELIIAIYIRVLVVYNLEVDDE